MPELKPHELDEAWQIWLQAGWNEGYAITPEEFRRSWEGSLVCCGLREAGRLVAIGRANGDGVLYAMIHDVVVAKEAQGRGFGQRVVEELVGALRSRKVRVIQLMAAADQAGFYERLGFRRRPDDRPGMEYAD